MQVVVDGLLTNYQLEGKKGPLLLLVHGWGDKLQTYDTLVQAMNGHYQVVRLDLPGFGATQPPASPWGLQDYADFTEHFIAKLDLKPVAAVGHSNGGAVLVKAVADDQLGVKQLILLASAGIRNRQNFRKTILRAVAKIGKAATFWLPATKRQQLQRRLYGSIGSDYLAVPHLQETFKRTVAEDITADATRVDLPTLLIYGDKDTATPVQEIGLPLHHAIKGSRLAIVHGSDHFVHQQATAQVTQLIKEFIDDTKSV